MKVDRSQSSEWKITVEQVTRVGAFFDAAGACFLVDDEGGVQVLAHDASYSLFRFPLNISEWNWEGSNYRLPRPGETVTLTF